MRHKNETPKNPGKSFVLGHTRGTLPKSDTKREHRRVAIHLINT